MNLSILDERPLIVALTGSNGAGKTTFYYAFLARSGLRFVHADEIAAALQIDAYEAARLADALRRTLLSARDSFIFETVFSDPVGDKIAFMQDAEDRGYRTALFFIGLADEELSRQRVAMRVLQGGHDVPDEKLQDHFQRTRANLERAIRALPLVFVYDNSDLRDPYRRVAVFERGALIERGEPLPGWLEPLISAL